SGMLNEPVKTFSVGFEEREANELKYARLVSRAFRTDHYETVIGSAEFFDALPGLLYHEDEPIAHPSSIPLFFVSQLAAGHVKVVLTGEGADELLAGYGKYLKTIYNVKLARAYERVLPRAARSGIAGFIERLGGSNSLGAKLRRSFLCVNPSLEEI